MNKPHCYFSQPTKSENVLKLSSTIRDIMCSCTKSGSGPFILRRLRLAMKTTKRKKNGILSVFAKKNWNMKICTLSQIALPTNVIMLTTHVFFTTPNSDFMEATPKLKVEVQCVRHLK